MNAVAIGDRLLWSSQHLHSGDQDTDGNAGEHDKRDKSQPTN
jgi:hypothetical protein